MDAPHGCLQSRISSVGPRARNSRGGTSVRTTLIPAVERRGSHLCRNVERSRMTRGESDHGDLPSFESSDRFSYVADDGGVCLLGDGRVCHWAAARRPTGCVHSPPHYHLAPRRCFVLLVLDPLCLALDPLVDLRHSSKRTDVEHTYRRGGWIGRCDHISGGTRSCTSQISVYMCERDKGR